MAMQTALRWRDGALTYARLDELVLRCAGALARTGVREGDCMAMLAPPCWQQVVVFFSAAELAAVFVGLTRATASPSTTTYCATRGQWVFSAATRSSRRRTARRRVPR